MQKKNIFIGALIALLAGATAVSLVVAVRLNSKLLELENRQITGLPVVAEAGSVPTNEVAKTVRHEMRVDFAHRTNVTLRVRKGFPVYGIAASSNVVFEDAPFAPKDWKGFTFGNTERSLKPNFRRLPKARLDDKGVYRFVAPIWADFGLPCAAVKATGQGTVFEDGGRPATARKSVVCHYYPYYIGTTLNGWLRLPQAGFPKVELACVTPINDTCKLAGSFDFAGYAVGNYAPVERGALYDAGTTEGLTVAATDLAGRPRILHKGRIDIGCFECRPRKGMALILR